MRKISWAFVLIIILTSVGCTASRFEGETLTPTEPSRNPTQEKSNKIKSIEPTSTRLQMTHKAIMTATPTITRSPKLVSTIPPTRSKEIKSMKIIDTLGNYNHNDQGWLNDSTYFAHGYSYKKPEEYVFYDVIKNQILKYEKFTYGNEKAASEVEKDGKGEVRFWLRSPSGKKAVILRRNAVKGVMYFKNEGVGSKIEVLDLWIWDEKKGIQLIEPGFTEKYGYGLNIMKTVWTKDERYVMGVCDSYFGGDFMIDWERRTVESMLKWDKEEAALFSISPRGTWIVIGLKPVMAGMFDEFRAIRAEEVMKEKGEMKESILDKTGMILDMNQLEAYSITWNDDEKSMYYHAGNDRIIEYNLETRTAKVVIDRNDVERSLNFGLFHNFMTANLSPDNKRMMVFTAMETKAILVEFAK